MFSKTILHQLVDLIQQVRPPLGALGLGGAATSGVVREQPVLLPVQVRQRALPIGGTAPAAQGEAVWGGGRTMTVAVYGGKNMFH